MRARTALGLACTAMLFAACVGGKRPNAAPPRAVALQWPEADALFHGEPRWLGADGAYSVPLHDGRIVWLFGDTFVATSAAYVRTESKIVRNTVAIQRGNDPVTADMSFHWRGTRDAPESFIPDEGDHWYWPRHGVALGAGLVLFLQRVKATPGRGLGFEVDGWRLAIVENAVGSPVHWQLRIVAPTTMPAGIAVGTAVVSEGDHVVALADREPGDHAGFLVRWRKADLLAGQIDRAEWWTADRGWLAQAALRATPSPVMPDAGPEASIHFDAAQRKWVHLRSDGFGATTIVEAHAEHLEGPWSAARVVFRPPESDRVNILVYAAKGHPELAAGGALAITYATNTVNDLAGLVNDTSLYYPRFVKLVR